MPVPSLTSLQKQATTIARLPAKAQAVVDRYLHITVDGVSCACPYHINPGIHSKNRAQLGKGSPDEIEALAGKYFKQYDMRTEGSSERLRAYLYACGIGIDCSGFTSWVMNEVTKERLGGPVWKFLSFPGVRRTVVSTLRPVQNISANLLTGHTNSAPVRDITTVRPGDLLRVAGWHHVVVVTEVGLEKHGKACYFRYAQSSCMYGMESGVRTGYVAITAPNGLLSDQQWFDGYRGNPIEALIRAGGEDNRLVRLRCLLAG